MEDFGIVSDDNGDASPALDKVRKLLAKAESTDSDAERDALNARAAELIAKYGIDEAMASAGRPSGDDMALKEYEIRGDYADEIARLLVGLAIALGAQGILTYEGATVVGYLADIERLEVLYTSLSLQMHSGAVRVDGTVSVRRGWMTGFKDVVVQRVRDAEARARHDAGGKGSSTDLVLASREVAVRNAFREEFPSVGFSRPRVNLAQYGSGAAAGRRASIGGSSVGRSRQAIG
jgi:hypothetical protein